MMLEFNHLSQFRGGLLWKSNFQTPTKCFAELQTITSYNKLCHLGIPKLIHIYILRAFDAQLWYIAITRFCQLTGKKSNFLGGMKNIKTQSFENNRIIVIQNSKAKVIKRGSTLHAWYIFIGSSKTRGRQEIVGAITGWSRKFFVAEKIPVLSGRLGRLLNVLNVLKNYICIISFNITALVRTYSS